MPNYVIVTGIPASGKSTVGRTLAQALELPLLDKDEFLESIFRRAGVGNEEWRRKLSREADCELRRQAERSSGAVLCSWWKHPRSEVESGTPSEWLSSLQGRLIEVHCRCSAATAARRYASRTRHPGHLDGFRSEEELRASFTVQASFGPLGIGSLVEIDSENAMDLQAVADAVIQALAEPEG
jgi:hypothetical protein